jgi:hypothetical protein
MWSKTYVGLHVKHPLFLSDLMKLEFSRRVFEKYPNMKFNENPPGESRVNQCGILSLCLSIMTPRRMGDWRYRSTYSWRQTLCSWRKNSEDPLEINLCATDSSSGRGSEQTNFIRAGYRTWIFRTLAIPSYYRVIRCGITKILKEACRNLFSSINKFSFNSKKFGNTRRMCLET